MGATPITLFAACLVSHARAITQGCLKLDNLTFDKFLATPNLTHFVKIDEPSTHGENKASFDLVCAKSHLVPNLFVSEVPVQRFNNDKENDDIRIRFNLTREEFPAYYLFDAANKKGLRYR